jgi:hypothetical protein
MATPLYPPDIEGHITTTIITNPNKAADTDIDFDANDPKINTREIRPIISIDLLDFDRTGPSFSFKKYNADNYGTPGSLASGQMAVIDEDTIRIGDATNVANHDYVLIIKHLAGRTKNI